MMREKVTELLRKHCDIKTCDYETKLVSDAVIDSIQWLGLIEGLEESFSISIPIEERTPENFDSVDRICSVLMKLMYTGVMKLGIYGSGGTGRTVKDIVDLIGKWDEVVFIDDTVKPDVFKGTRRMPFDQFKDEYPATEARIVIALGEPKYKKMVFERVKSHGYDLENVIHPTAVVSPSAYLGEGIIAHIGAVISVDTVVEDNVTLQQYALLAHDTKVSAHSQISAFAMVAGHCKVGECTYIGPHAAIKDRIRIGSYDLVGMGAMVMKDVPDFVTVAGNPARVISRRSIEDMVFA